MKSVLHFSVRETTFLKNLDHPALHSAAMLCCCSHVRGGKCTRTICPTGNTITLVPTLENDCRWMKLSKANSYSLELLHLNITLLQSNGPCYFALI